MSDQQPTPPTDDLLPHDFDGIRERDRDPPLWFNVLFYGSIIWGIGYVLHYHWGPGKTGRDEWKEGMVALHETRAKNATGPLPEEQLRELSKNTDRIARGKALYASAGCVACHGPEAAGSVGPNLTDKFWIHGSKMSEIVDVIAKGRTSAAGVMPGQTMAMDDISNLTIYLVSLNRAGAKPGKPIDPAREKENPINY